MDICINEIIVENFKSYEQMQKIDISDLSIFMGANSSGKSTALQALLAIKQTMECNSPEIDLLLSGKYVTLGDFGDVINDSTKGYIKIGVSTVGGKRREEYGTESRNEIVWEFSKDTRGQIKLENTKLEMANEKVELRHEDGDSYRIFLNNYDTHLSVELSNLKLAEFVVNYDKKFNEEFHEFVSCLLQLFNTGKKINTIEKTKMVCINGVDQLYYNIIHNGNNMNITVNATKEDAKKAEKLSERLLKLLDAYSYYQFKYFELYTSLPEEVKKNLLMAIILQNNISKAIMELCVKYEKNFAEYQNTNELKNRDDGKEVLPRNSIYRLHSGEKGQGTDIDIISETFMNYREFIREIIAKIFYLGPIREKPQGLYNVGFETIPKYVGTTGAYFASVLLHENKVKDYILPNNMFDSMSLLEALDEWAVHLNIASAVQVEQSNSFGFSVSVANTQQKKSDIMNVGIGTSQVLPVLITGLLSAEGEVLIFEQPELHLHPYSQSRLADFFVSLVQKGRKIIVETHSEYFILRMRYHILMNNISETQIIINFFQNNNGTQVSKGILSGYGNLQYPEDFCDETQELINDLMNASLIKRK